MVEDNIFIAIIDAMDPIVAEILDFLVFPLDAVIGFLWGGISEIIREVLF